MYKFKIFNNLEGECDKVWREFEKKSSHNFFQDFDYIKQLVNKENLVNIVFIYYEEKIIMILPLEIKKYFIFNVLQWIGTGVSDFCNPTILKDEKFKIDDQKFLQTWKKIISNIKGFDLIFLNNQASIIENTSNNYPLSQTPFSRFLSGNVSLTPDGYITTSKKKGGILEIKIVSNEKEDSYLQLDFSLNPFQLRRWVIIDQIGTEIAVMLQNHRFDVELPAKTFRGMPIHTE